MREILVVNNLIYSRVIRLYIENMIKLHDVVFIYLSFIISPTGLFYQHRLNWEKGFELGKSDLNWEKFELGKLS